MKTNKAGVDIIKHYESLRLKAYYCPEGILTIGYGHTGPDVKEGMEITEERADELLQQDIEEREKQLDKLKLNLNENQYSAILSFIFNLGIGNFRKSDLYKVIRKNPNNAEMIKVSNIPSNYTCLKFMPKDLAKITLIRYKFLSWARKYRGLYLRRESEYKLYAS